MTHAAFQCICPQTVTFKPDTEWTDRPSSLYSFCYYEVLLQPRLSISSAYDLWNSHIFWADINYYTTKNRLLSQEIFLFRKYLEDEVTNKMYGKWDMYKSYADLFSLASKMEFAHSIIHWKGPVNDWISLQRKQECPWNTALFLYVIII